jgi:hypothetical protein
MEPVTVRTPEEDWERQRLWREDRDRRFAARVVSRSACTRLTRTAGWRDEEPDDQPECDYDPATDHFLLDGKVVPPPHFSPEWGEAWEAWRHTHGLDESIWEMATPDDGRSLWRLHHKQEPGYVTWFGDSEDAADSEADDIDDDNESEPSGEYLVARSDIDIGRPVYADEHLGSGWHDCEVWGLFEVLSYPDGDWRPELVTGGMILAQARNLAEEMGVSRLLD